LDFRIVGAGLASALLFCRGTIFCALSSRPLALAGGLSIDLVRASILSTRSTNVVEVIGERGDVLLPFAFSQSKATLTIGWIEL